MKIDELTAYYLLVIALVCYSMFKTYRAIKQRVLIDRYEGEEMYRLEAKRKPITFWATMVVHLAFEISLFILLLTLFLTVLYFKKP